MRYSCVLLAVSLTGKVVIVGSLHLPQAGVDCCLSASEGGAIGTAVRSS